MLVLAIRRMTFPHAARPAYRFGRFELDVGARELRKDGVRLRLQDQPFEVLVMLLEQPGEVLTRDELRQRLWPDGTFVDFEHGLNAAVKRLRARDRRQCRASAIRRDAAIGADTGSSGRSSASALAASTAADEPARQGCGWRCCR